MSMLLNAFLAAAIGGGSLDTIRLVGSQITTTQQFVAGTSLTYSLSGGDSGYAASVPAANDTVVAFAGGAGIGNKALILKGFDTVSDFRDDTGDANGIIGVKRMGVTPDTSLYYTSTASATPLHIIIYVFRNVDAYDPLDVAIQATGGINGLQGAPAAITPTTVGAMIIEAINGAIGAAADGTYTIPGTLTDGLQAHGTTGSGTLYGSVGAGLKRSWASGTWTPSTWSNSRGTNAVDSWNGFTLALRPSGGTAPASATVDSRTAGATSAVNTTSHIIDVPTGLTTGKLIVVKWSPNASVTASALSDAGYIAFGSGPANATHSSYIFWKWATGSDALTITSSVTTQSTHLVYVISGADTTKTTSGNPPLVGTYTNNTSNVADPDCPAVAPGVGTKAWLWLTFGSWDGSGGPITPISCPAKYTNMVTSVSTGSNQASTAGAERRASNASEDPAQWWAASEQCVIWTVGVYPA